MMYVARRPEDGSIFMARKDLFTAKVGGVAVKVDQVRDDDKDVLAFLGTPERPSDMDQLKARVAALETKEGR